MTFMDISRGRPTPGLIAGYSILCVVSLVCFYWAVSIGRSRQHYRSFFSVRILFPLALFISALENAALASSGRFYDEYAGDDDTVDDEEEATFESNFFIRAVIVLQ